MRRPVATLKTRLRHRFASAVQASKVGLNHVLDVGEIAALSAVAENGRLFSVQHLSDELGQHTRVGRSWVLARAEDIEVSQADRFQAITLIKGAM